MSKCVFHAGAFRRSPRQYVFSSGSWRPIMMTWVYQAGAWRRMDSLRWSAGAWGSCSKICGGGTQSRSVQCLNSWGNTVPDLWCSRFVGTKPATVQACNSHVCTTSHYSRAAPQTFARHCHITTWFMWNGQQIATGRAEKDAQSATWSFLSVDVGQWRYSRGEFRERLVTDCTWKEAKNERSAPGNYYEINRTQLW